MSDQVALTPEHSGLVDSFIASGRFEGPQAVIGAALALLEGRERERTEKLRALHDAVSGDMEATFREIEQLIACGLATFQTPALREAC
ncbi:type II toxin-antitoxin system ParD family antitoxin [Xanthobacter agilis]|jgi:Arc/MetJ-type ribon-helix-helix transcriptional regulator|uniref:Arc/MetJ-type ribon-helix-helix transcriptional regulator n=1 Tax=Xanthobacter agilis TaxID=47492 RepID=A0ABU0LJH3_XANAG|nr:type II toxin-antitoxin system ParD family antitoxin [Xanthobacter agilis]MDQ0507286.1 Arc/MetJ-type ribon-helix-helix transcriptional regulator [Xanthobacter agilis]